MQTAGSYEKLIKDPSGENLLDAGVETVTTGLVGSDMASNMAEQVVDQVKGYISDGVQNIPIVGPVYNFFNSDDTNQTKLTETRAETNTAQNTGAQGDGQNNIEMTAEINLNLDNKRYKHSLLR